MKRHIELEICKEKFFATERTIQDEIESIVDIMLLYTTSLSRIEDVIMDIYSELNFDDVQKEWIREEIKSLVGDSAT